MALYVFETALRVATNFRRQQAVLGWRLRAKDALFKRRIMQRMHAVEQDVRAEMAAISSQDHGLRLKVSRSNTLRNPPVDCNPENPRTREPLTHP